MRTSNMSSVPALPEENSNVPGLHSIPRRSVLILIKAPRGDKIHYYTEKWNSKLKIFNHIQDQSKST